MWLSYAKQNVTTTDVDIIFNKVKNHGGRNRRRIGFEEFVNAFVMFAEMRFIKPRRPKRSHDTLVTSSESVLDPTAPPRQMLATPTTPTVLVGLNASSNTSLTSMRVRRQAKGGKGASKSTDSLTDGRRRFKGTFGMEDVGGVSTPSRTYHPVIPAIDPFTLPISRAYQGHGEVTMIVAGMFDMWIEVDRHGGRSREYGEETDGSRHTCHIESVVGANFTICLDDQLSSAHAYEVQLRADGVHLATRIFKGQTRSYRISGKRVGDDLFQPLLFVRPTLIEDATPDVDVRSLGTIEASFAWCRIDSETKDVFQPKDGGGGRPAIEPGRIICERVKKG
ncbi:hypothetical protein HK101_006684, partial [Irineochytrium annulatum]